MKPTLAFFAGGVLALALAACAEASSPPPLLPDPGSDGTYTVDWPDLGGGEERFISIDIGPDSFEICRQVSPKFPFDSARTRAQSKAQLVALASCLNRPNMAARSVLLVGRADGRGTTDYNKELGIKRAARVKELLIASGLSEDRIKVSSEGEAGAVGDQPEYSQGFDRRVDVVILGGDHAP